MLTAILLSPSADLSVLDLCDAFGEHWVGCAASTAFANGVFVLSQILSYARLMRITDASFQPPDALRKSFLPVGDGDDCADHCPTGRRRL
jgi:hypothetical protein